MAKVKSASSPKTGRPALTPEARENQMISLAVDLAEKQLREGTASSQVITHFLKLGTTKAELEKEKLMGENELLRAKTEAIQDDRRNAEFYEEVLVALKRYNGQGGSDDDEDY